MQRLEKPYYGWWLVAGAVICQFVSMSLGQAIVGIFMRPVIAELGWSVWQFTLGPSLAGGLGALAGILAGRILDRRGPRPLFLVGALVCAICFYGLGRQSNVWLYWLLYIVAGLMGWNLFGPTIINAVLTKWFVRQRGWALALGSIGISLSSLITPLAMTTLVDVAGWRNGYQFLAIFALVAIVPLVFVMRRTPEDDGLWPDGDVDRPDTATATTPSAYDEDAFTSQAAIRTKSFWLLVLGFGLNLTALSSVLVHAIPFATEAGFTRHIAAMALTVNGLGNLVSKAVWGYSLQRIEPRWLVVAAYSISAAGVSLMLVAAAWGATPTLFLGFFLYGFGFGGTIPLSEFLWANYFGRAHIGAIRGLSQPLMIIGPTFGPVLVGLWYDASQTYQPAFLTLIGLYLTGAFLVWISRAPAKDSW